MNQPISSGGLAPPLRVARDMAPVWRSTDELSFDDAAEILVRAHEKDGVVEDRPLLDLRSWAVVSHQGQFALRALSSRAEPLLLRATALSNFAARLGAPGEFIRAKLPAELQLALLNYLLASQDRPQPVLLRLRGGEVTTLVSERYATLSPEQFVEGIRASLRHQGLLGEVRVRAIATGTTDALRLVFERDRHELKVGDVTQVGLDVSTSCFGKSAVHVTGVLYRLVCMNGLRVPEKMGRFSFRHIGETERIQAALRDAVPTALFHARDFLNYWQSALVTHIHGVADTIERMRLLTQAERTLVGGEGARGLSLVEGVLDGLPKPPAKFSKSSRRQIIQAIHRLLTLAVYPAKLLTANPLPKGFLPKVGKGRAKAYVYPSEDAALMRYTDAPLVERLFFGTLAREGMRVSEALSLTWSDLDLTRGVIHLDENKTEDPRTWALDPGVTAALLKWRKKLGDRAASGTRVFSPPGGPSVDRLKLAAGLRRYLILAGVDRAQLFESSEARIQLRAHDLRATFVTVNLALGKTEAWITDRTGHRSSQMIYTYKRAARTHAELELGQFEPLGDVIPDWD